MLSGDPMLRKSLGLGKDTQSCYRCFSGANFGGNVYSPCFDPKLDTDHLPATPCLGGIRSSVMFPMLGTRNKRILTQWLTRGTDAGTARTSIRPTTRYWLQRVGVDDGTNGEQDHVAHPISGPPSFTITNGVCPDSHPVKVPQITLEIMWDTTKFNNKEDWPEDGSQPFVLSTGDT